MEKNHGASRSKVDEGRKNKIREALDKYGYTVDQLKNAIDGNKKSAWHQGGGPQGVIYDSIGLIFRNPEKIEEFLAKFNTEGAVKNKNVSTGFKLGFTERQKSQVNMLKKMGDKYFPELSDNPKAEIKYQNLLTLRQENPANE